MKGNNNHSKFNINLEDLPKKQVYEVPDGYFDKLPSVIQAKAVDSKKSSSTVFNWSLAWRYAMPIVALVLMVTYFTLRIKKQDIDVEAMIGDVPTEELVAYLTESDITTEELLSIIDIDELDVDGMINENIELLNDNEWDELLDEYPDIEDDIL